MRCRFDLKQQLFCFLALRVFTSAIEKNRVIFEKVPVNLKDLEKSSKEIDAGFALVVRERGIQLFE